MKKEDCLAGDIVKFQIEEENIPELNFYVLAVVLDFYGFCELKGAEEKKDPDKVYLMVLGHKDILTVSKPEFFAKKAEKIELLTRKYWKLGDVIKSFELFLSLGTGRQISYYGHLINDLKRLKNYWSGDGGDGSGFIKKIKIGVPEKKEIDFSRLASVQVQEKSPIIYENHLCLSCGKYGCDVWCLGHQILPFESEFVKEFNLLEISKEKLH